jgi:hypothetical protein
VIVRKLESGQEQTPIDISWSPKKIKIMKPTQKKSSRHKLFTMKNGRFEAMELDNSDDDDEKLTKHLKDRGCDSKEHCEKLLELVHEMPLPSVKGHLQYIKDKHADLRVRVPKKVADCPARLLKALRKCNKSIHNHQPNSQPLPHENDSNSSHSACQLIFVCFDHSIRK